MRRPPQIVDRVRTTATQINHAFQSPRPSCKATAPASQDNPYLQQPRLDGAKSDQLVFFRGHRSLQMRCSPKTRARAPSLPLGPQIDVPARTGWQVAHLSTLSNPLGPGWFGASTQVSPRPPKCSPRSSPYSILEYLKLPL